MTDNPNEDRTHNEARFKAIKAEREADKFKAAADYASDARSIREKTARLRSLRLAKEAADMTKTSLAPSKKRSS